MAQGSIFLINAAFDKRLWEIQLNNIVKLNAKILPISALYLKNNGLSKIADLSHDFKLLFFLIFLILQFIRENRLFLKKT
jgi:hypothetical protein